MSTNKKIKNILITAILTITLCGIPFTGCNLNNKTNEQSANTQSTQVNTNDAKSKMNQLTIAEADNSPYDRKGDWGGEWKYDKTTKQNTRTKVLQQQGTDVKLDNNKVVAGNWYIKYNGENVSYDDKETISRSLQIDHVVPVSYCNQHGGYAWNEDKKLEFYNDFGVEDACSAGNNGVNDYKKIGNLIVSDSHSNTSKSDKGPSEWLPSNKSYQKEYCAQWVNICVSYGISVSQADYDVIYKVLS